MSIRTREDTQGRVRWEARSGELEAALRRALRGRRARGPYTRHLYAADASMYARRAARRRVPAQRGRRRGGGRRSPARIGVPVVSRGGGTSLAGQAAGGRGIVLDHSRHLRRDRRDRRREAGACASSRASCRRRSTPPRSRTGSASARTPRPSNRATLGGMIGNNSSGQRVDRARHHDRPRARARGRALRRLARHVRSARRGGVGAARAGGHAGGRDPPRAARDPERHARAIAEDYPKHWRQSGGYRLDRFAASGGLDLAQLVTGSEGTLVAITAATVKLVELPRATMFAVGHFDSLAGAIAATQDGLDLGAASIEMIDRTILGLSRSKLEYRRLADMLEGDPEALLFVSFTGDSEARDAREARRARGRVARARPRLPHAARRVEGRPGRADQGPQGRARAADGGQPTARRARPRSSRTRRSRPSASASTWRASARCSTATT